nr:MAG TPA: hypothetical protein [Caudoviricetes sp.]
MGVEQLKTTACRQKCIWDARKSEGIIQICWVMPNSFFGI